MTVCPAPIPLRSTISAHRFPTKRRGLLHHDTPFRRALVGSTINMVDADGVFICPLVIVYNVIWLVSSLRNSRVPLSPQGWAMMPESRLTIFNRRGLLEQDGRDERKLELCKVLFRHAQAFLYAHFGLVERLSLDVSSVYLCTPSSLPWAFPVRTRAACTTILPTCPAAKVEMLQCSPLAPQTCTAHHAPLPHPCDNGTN